MAEPQSHHRLLPGTNHERLEHEEQVLQPLAAQRGVALVGGKER